MENDRAFATYSLGLIALTILVATWGMAATDLSLTAAKTALLIEHLVMAVTFRAAYKSLDGSNWVLDLLRATGMVTPTDEITREEIMAPSGGNVAAAA